MAQSRQPPRLFSPVTSCRPHSAFQRSAYTIIALFAFLCNSARNMIHTGACANAALLTYSLACCLVTDSAPRSIYSLDASRWNRERYQRAYSGVPYS